MSSLSRHDILQVIQSHLRAQVDELEQSFRELKEANESNAKSTAGDDHDTERAMVHMEMENLSKSIDNASRYLHLADEWTRTKSPTEARDGSLVFTDRGIFVLGIPCGKIPFSDSLLMGISSQSPLGQSFLDKVEGAAISLNGVSYLIQTLK